MSEHAHDHQHRDVTGGWLRPAVFGAMDGLVSNTALMAGVAGGTSSSANDSTAVVLAGLAGLAAGAFSMAAGEYTSVASQRELAQAEFEVERLELRRHPEAETQELAESLQARGVEPGIALEVARQLSRDPESALEVHARAELGVSPSDLPRPWLAAASSFLAFALGALLPLLPYLFGAHELWPTAVVGAVGLFVAGALVSRVTVRPWWYSGTRQLLVGSVAAVVTYAVGLLVGASLG